MHAEDWDVEAMRAAVKEVFGFLPTVDEKKALDRELLTSSMWEELEKVIEARETEFGLSVVLSLARYFYLQEIDERWIEHLKTMEALREGIGLRGYGQKDPKQEYKKEGFTIFGEMIVNIGRNVCEKLYHMQVKREEQPQPAKPRAARKTIESGGGAAPAAASAGTNGQGGDAEPKPMRRTEPKVGRNDPCPCGSGKKYKKCHGAQATA